MENRATVMKKRLCLKKRKEGSVTIDKLLNFVIGEIDPEERAKLRGPVFEVRDQFQALEMYQDLKVMAQEARAEGSEIEFLDGLNGVRSSGDCDDQLFSDFAKEWFETCIEESSFSEGDARSTEYILRLHLVPFFGKCRLSQINVRLIDKFVAKKRRQKQLYGTGYSAKTINNLLSVLCRCMRKAVKYGILRKNPVLESDAWQKLEQTQEDQQNWLNPDEETTLIEWLWCNLLDKPNQRQAMLTQLVCGLRYSELRALKGIDLIEVPYTGIWIRRAMPLKKLKTPKNNKTRIQALPADMFRELKDLVGDDPNEFLFKSTYAPHLVNSTYNKWLNAACRAAGVPEIASHGLRHTAGTSYAAMGYSQKTIASLLGHKSTKSTERYVHAAESVKKEAVHSRWDNVGLPNNKQPANERARS